MKKRLFLGIFTVIISLLFIGNISARTKFVCTYQYNLGELPEYYPMEIEVQYYVDGNTYEEIAIKFISGEEEQDATEMYDLLLDEVSESEPRPCPALFIKTEGSKKFLQQASLVGQLEYLYYEYSETIVGNSICTNYKDQKGCEFSGTTGKVACLWIENSKHPGGGYCNVDNLLYVGCGGAQDIPMQAPKIISFVINFLKIATPIILIFVAIISLLKAMSAGKEDEMKKATSSLVRRLIAAALVFFVTTIVQFIVLKVADGSDKEGIPTCLSCFLNNDCEVNTYYKTVASGEDYCTPLSTGKTESCDSIFK